MLPGAGVVLTIIMPTFNSENTISMALKSIEAQSFTKDALEILVIDGGSSDGTREIAARYGCRLLENQRVQPEYAKAIGIAEARGRFAMFLDSDEVLANRESLSNKVDFLKRHPEVKNIITAGLLNPPGYPAINDYANRFGEPFSYFMYRLDGGDYVSSLKSKYQTCYEDDLGVIVKFSEFDILPICDGGGHCFDLSYLKTVTDITHTNVVPVVFQRMAAETGTLAVLRNDYTLHYSTTSLRRYLSKLQWRIIANMHESTGTEGYLNREKGHPKSFRFKKYLFIFYALTFVAPLIDAVRLSLRHKKIDFMVHFPLAVYTALFIVFQYALKVGGVRPTLKNYGE